MRFEGTSGQRFGEMEAEIVRLKMQRNGMEVERDSLKRCCDELEARLASLEEFAEKVRPLVREVGGNLGAFEWAMRESIGNTNYACLKDKHEAALGALDALDAAKEGGE